MGLILAVVLLFVFAVSAAAGFQILLSSPSSDQRRRQRYDRSTAILWLLSVVLFVIFKAALPSSPSSHATMTRDFQMAAFALVAGGGSFGFAISAALGVLLMIVARFSRRR